MVCGEVKRGLFGFMGGAENQINKGDHVAGREGVIVSEKTKSSLTHGTVGSSA